MPPMKDCTHLALIYSLLLLPSATHAETFNEVNGVVSMEAEHYTSNNGYTARSDNGANNEAAGWSGDGWMYSDSNTAQRMNYQINFTHTGTYYVHLRALAGFNSDWITDWEGLDNGYHAEFDGASISGLGIFIKKTQKWVWYGTIQKSSPPVPVSVTVNTPGVHTFSIVRREQLSRLDKIVIHDGTYGTDPASTLTGAGPAETVNTGSTPDAGAAVDAGATVDASVGGDASSGARMRIEAEHMSLQVYRVESGAGYASNDQMITLRDGAAGETGTASTSFSGEPGLYDVVVAYFDENDGVASLALHIDGVRVADFDLDQDLGHASSSAQTLVRRPVASAHALARGSIISVTGVEDPNEPARVDYIELIAVSAAHDDAGANDVVVVPRDAGVGDNAQDATDSAPPGGRVSPTSGCATTPLKGPPTSLLLSAILCLAWLRRRPLRR